MSRKKRVRHNKRRFQYSVLAFSLLILLWLGLAWHEESASPLHQSSARILVKSDDSEAISDLAVMMSDQPMLNKLVKELQLPYSIHELEDKVSIQIVADAQVVRISVTDNKSYQSRLIANTLARLAKNDLAAVLNIESVQLISSAAKDVDLKSAP
ncbi:hypothetical protein MUN88_20965 [Gracilibacillus caseinilyticus]|uniref:Stage III sporulation protein AG n=1 Tax=Gracilibacillus caseinilyticus TaxID=2932256 RepID=A0ABY4EVN7_9BACI|nr:hypothetical protein [Gracilibacillus caseinilyticus]UOQ48472.1 hypothetical protein MUN88_20965 [Gracilibacillus caseinilyticus]